MRKLLASLFAAATVAAIASTAAFAGTTPGTIGTPGTTNCTGQTMTWLAQTAGGVVGYAKAYGLTVPQLKQEVEQYCLGPGTPGSPNCVGRTMAYLAQASKLELNAPGVGGIAKVNGLTVQQVKQIVEQDFCPAP